MCVCGYIQHERHADGKVARGDLPSSHVCERLYACMYIYLRGMRTRVLIFSKREERCVRCIRESRRILGRVCKNKREKERVRDVCDVDRCNFGADDAGIFL